MRVRRCTVLFLEPREDVGFCLEALLAGGSGLRRQRRWVALAAHLDAEVEVDAADFALLGRLSAGEWVEAGALASPQDWRRLLDAGLLIRERESAAGDEAAGHAAESETAEQARHRQCDEAVRGGHWWPAAALLHRSGRWQGIDSVRSMEDNGMLLARDLREKLGPPPPDVHERVAAHQRRPLPAAAEDEFEALLARRATCRNFDAGRVVPEAVFARMLQRVFAARARVEVCADTAFLKRTSPSGGGLHATDAYLVVQNVEDISPGLYHYHPVDHALEPLPAPSLPLADFARLALAGQHWFAGAPVLAVLVPRFARSFWKYRNHAKAYRALVLDSGHLSQTLYLSATQLGLGAFVTSAINEIDIEQAFDLDPLRESPLAICGFGWRAEQMAIPEFDPAAAIWNSPA